MGNILSLVGRPNVGKSTLFNRLTQSREAIVDPTAGVTRDRNYGKSEWCGTDFSVIDTGGYVLGSDDIFEEEISKQVSLAIEESDVIVFLTDGRDGITPMDSDVAALLRKSGKPVILAVNKIDSPSNYFDYGEFYKLGIGEPIPISSNSGSGTGELLDAALQYFTNKVAEEEVYLPKIAIVGRPNVGKSSIVNMLLGEERNIVTEIAGTTRDSIYTRYNNFGFNFYLVDTAGVRKKKNVDENIEFYSVMRSVRAIEDADICVLMVDASVGFEGQDLNIFSLIQRNNKGVVIVVNKWDLIEKENKTYLEYERIIRSRIAPFSDVPIVFTSVHTKQRVYKVIETAIQVYENRSRRITTSQLNEIFLPIIKDNPPPMSKGKAIKVKYITQLPIAYPAFVLFCNLPQYIKESYYRFVENKIRDAFDFSGVPIKIYFRKK
ncbi:MAG: ribosome biogenesis GTPase Der [Bacteroidota bacterium]|jgi:GTP-binding protein